MGLRQRPRFLFYSVEVATLAWLLAANVVALDGVAMPIMLSDREATSRTVYRDRLQSQARALAEIALALVAVEARDDDPKGELDTHELGHAVTRLCIVLGRMAESGDLQPTSATAFLGPEQPLTDIAVLDAYSFFLFADMVLEGWARVEGARRPGLGQVAWKDLVRSIDTTDDPLLPFVRYLNITVSVGRDLAVVHVPSGQYFAASFGDGTATIGRVSSITEDGNPYAEAIGLLKRALDLPTTESGDVTTFGNLTDLILDAAWQLDYEHAGHARRAFALAGFHSPPIPWMVDPIITLLRDHLRRRGLVPGPLEAPAA